MSPSGPGSNDGAGPAAPGKGVRPEILAPAGDPLCLRAAMAAGADAVYLGMTRFNARGRAERFRGLTLKACVGAAHERGVRVYVTLNTLVHDDELQLALDLAAEATDAGADAVIVQDLGLASLLRHHLPALTLHGSTQMSLHQADQAEEAVRRLGLRRIIVARECSVEEVRRIAARIRPLGAGVEVFVHGALCYAYSGQCLMSNFAGRRSANRGICAQNCRFDFTRGPVLPALDTPRASVPVPDGETPPRGPAAGQAAVGASCRLPRFDAKTATQLISMKDLAAFDSVSALADSGVQAFKVEGRLKGPDYVAQVVRLYRAALDAWASRRPFAVEEAERAAGRVFSRGFTNGYLAGCIDPSMRGDKRSLEGEPDATVVSANRKLGLLVLRPRPGHRVRAGQGYRYVHDRYRGGFRVLSVEETPAGLMHARVRFGAEARGRSHRRGASGRDRPPPPLPDGLGCYLNDDPDMEKEVQELVASVKISDQPPPVGVRVVLSGGVGKPLCARVEAEDGRAGEAQTTQLLERAAKRTLEPSVLEEHLGRFGGTPYRLAGIDLSGLEPGLFLGFPAMHELRRSLVARLDALPPRPGTAHARRATLNIPPVESKRLVTELSVCISTPSALEAALSAGADRVVVEDRELYVRPESWARKWSVAAPRSVSLSGEPGGVHLWYRLPPIVHAEDDDRRAIDTIVRHVSCSGLIAGHLGQIFLAREAGLAIGADAYLNAYNHRAVSELEQSGARRVTLSWEVEAAEAVRVCGRVGCEVEVAIGGAVPSMLTRQDHGLQGGEALLAVSEHGHAYRFERGGAGITILYEARELIGAEVLPLLVGKVHAVRLDLSHHSTSAVAEIVRAYRDAVDRLSAAGPQAVPVDALRRAAQAHARHAACGWFTGHLLRGARLLDGES